MSQAENRNITIPSRRAVLAGAAAVPLASAVALAGTPAPDAATLQGAFAAPPASDPILAAIEQHKVAFRLVQVAGNIRAHTIDAKWHHDYDAAECEAAKKADIAATDRADAAANALTTTRPTTMAGILALLRYVEEFNGGAFSEVDDWCSHPMFWPENEDEDDEIEVDLFGFAILANVRGALEALVVQS